MASQHLALQGGLAAANGAPAPAVVNPFAGLGGAAASPTSFRAALAKLAGCLVLSATGNALVSYFSTLLGERFAHRLKGRLMEVRRLHVDGAGRAGQERACSMVARQAKQAAAVPGIIAFRHACPLTPSATTCCWPADHHGTAAVVL